MKEGIKRFLVRKYRQMSMYVAPEESDDYGERVDVIFIEGTARSLHIIEAEPTFGRCFNPNHGFAQLDRFRANYKWLAIPKNETYEYRESALRGVCNEYGFGLIYVYQSQVREIIQPDKTTGNFLEDYPFAKLEWYHPNTRNKK